MNQGAAPTSKLENTHQTTVEDNACFIDRSLIHFCQDPTCQSKGRHIHETVSYQIRSEVRIEELRIPHTLQSCNFLLRPLPMKANAKV